MMKGLYLRFGFSVLAGVFFAACAVESVEETTVGNNAPMYMKGVCYHPGGQGRYHAQFRPH